MVDWDHDGDVDSEDIGISAMLLDDMSSEEEERTKRKKGCLSGCFGIAAIALSVLGASAGASESLQLRFLSWVP